MQSKTYQDLAIEPHAHTWQLADVLLGEGLQCDVTTLVVAAGLRTGWDVFPVRPIYESTNTSNVI
jgi:hypothetical protein